MRLEPRLKQNVIANFAGNAWIALISLAAIPVYIRLLGSEAYGVIGFYASLQIVLFMLDFGLSATMSREVSRLPTFDDDRGETQDLARTLEIVYWSIAAIIVAAIGALAPTLAMHWLKPKQLTPDELQLVLILMAVAVGAKWPFALYSGGLIGLQKQVRQNLIVTVTETFRVAGSIALLALWPSLTVFFVWQGLVSCLASLVIYRAFWCAMPQKTRNAPKFDYLQLKRVGRFAGGMTGISIAVTILVQTDKVILSKLLTLDQFGQYVAAGTLASGLYLVSKPIFSAHYPELSRLIVANDGRRLGATFRHGYALMAVCIAPVASVFIIFSSEIIEMWMNSAVIAHDVHGAFALLTFGTMLNALMNMPYALQLAHGWTSLALKANVIAVILLIPVLVMLTLSMGINGAALAWVFLNVGYVVAILPIMARRGMLHIGLWTVYLDFFIYPLAVSLSAVGMFKMLGRVLGVSSTAASLAVMIGGFAAAVCMAAMVIRETRGMLLYAVTSTIR